MPYACSRCLLVKLRTPADPVVFASEATTLEDGENIGTSKIDFQGHLCKRCVAWVYKDIANIDILKEK